MTYAQLMADLLTATDKQLSRPVVVLGPNGEAHWVIAIGVGDEGRLEIITQPTT